MTRFDESLKMMSLKVILLVRPGVEVLTYSQALIAKKYAAIIKSAVWFITGPKFLHVLSTSLRNSGVIAACRFGGGSPAPKALNRLLRGSKSEDRPMGLPGRCMGLSR